MFYRPNCLENVESSGANPFVGRHGVIGNASMPSLFILIHSFIGVKKSMILKETQSIYFLFLSDIVVVIISNRVAAQFASWLVAGLYDRRCQNECAALNCL